MVTTTKERKPYKSRGKYGELLHGNGCNLPNCADCFECQHDDCIAKERHILRARGSND